MTYLKIGITIILALALCSIMPTVLGENRQTNPVNTFSDPESEISFQYPSDWQSASEEYVQSMFGEYGNVMPVAMLLPDSFNGASFGIVLELLPFPMPLEIYHRNMRMSIQDSSAILSPSLPVLLGNLKGYKFNVTYTDGYPQKTFMLFIKDSKAFSIFFNLGSTDQSKDTKAINLMLNSLKIGNGTQALQDTAEPNPQIFSEVIDGIFDSMFSPISNSFTDDESGFKISFPQDWNGTRMNALVMDGAVVSPNGSGLSEDMTQIMIETANQALSEGSPYLTQGQEQTMSQKKMNKIIENYLPTVSVFMMDKGMLNLFAADPTVTEEPSSLTDLFHTLNSASSDCSILSVNYTMLNAIPAESSMSECVLDPNSDRTKSLSYVLSTNDKIIFIDYSAKLNEFDRYYGEAITSFKTVELRNSIDPLTILKE